MATVQYERDLRSTQKAIKRRKDSSIKWSYGERPLPGNGHVFVDGKARPVLKGTPWTPLLPNIGLSQGEAWERQARLGQTEADAAAFDDWESTQTHTGSYQPSVAKRKKNKTPASKLPSSRVPAETDVDAACSEMDLVGSPRRRGGQGTVLSIPAEASETAVAAARGILLYGADATEAPGPALSLGAFAKPNVRATEKLVKKEYEVLDTNGDAVTGRKARQVLRQETSGAPPAAPTPLDDEDFELV